MKCEICHESISKVDGTWTHYHGDVSCGTGDGSTAYPQFSHYAWIIDKDHLYDGQDYLADEAGTVGPYNAPSSNRQILGVSYAHRHQFRMYDDDGILYYTGTLYWNGDPEPDEEYVYGPLADFGEPNAGAVLIKYTGKPEWDCG